MTSRECLDYARLAADLARKHGADAAAVNVHFERTCQAAVRDSHIDSLQEATRRGVSISIYLGGRFSSHGTSDLRPEALDPFIRKAVALTRHLAADPFRQLPEPRDYEGRQQHDLDLVDPSCLESGSASCLASARALADAALRLGGNVVSVAGEFQENLSLAARVHTNGFEGENSGTTFSHFVSVTVDAGDGSLPEDCFYASSRHRRELPHPEAAAREAVQRARRRIGQRALPTAEYELLVENRAAGRLLTPLIGAMSGRAIQQRSSFLEGMQGQPVAHPSITIEDDPFIAGAPGSRLFDAEGLALRRRELIRRGTLEDLYIDSYHARKLGRRPTGGSPSNVVVRGEAAPLSALIAGIRRGVLVTQFVGGQSNSVTGDFSLGVAGIAIIAGELAHPVNEMNVSGNYIPLWKSVAGLGDEPYRYGILRTPALHFHAAQLSGS
ncbi:MAG: TldD/PmbA family protein [Bryobacterales bacterium]|nr:TldD/PmbA family protein [Bryobacterales bacterium]